MVDAMLVVGSPNSSNTQRLEKSAERAGCARAALVQRAADIDWSVFGASRASASPPAPPRPEVLVEEVIGAFAERYTVNVETVTTADEDMFFPLPRVLRGPEVANSSDAQGLKHRVLEISTFGNPHASVATAPSCICRRPQAS